MKRRSQYAEFVDNNFGPPQNTKSLFHYTSVDALNGILPDEAKLGEEICLRATHAKYLNDTKEVLLGVHFLFDFLYNENQGRRPSIEMLKKRLDDFETQWRRRFVISFSTKRESLPMWNMYADKGKGVVLEFKKIPSPSDKDLVLQCVYAKRKIKQVLKSNNSDAITVLKMHTPLILKHPAYSYEREVRLIGIFESAAVKDRHKIGILIPYIE